MRRGWIVSSLRRRGSWTCERFGPGPARGASAGRMRGPLSSCSGFMRLSRRHVQVSREGPHRVLGGVASCLVNKITTGAGRAARAGHRAYMAAGGIKSTHAPCSHPQCLKAFFFLRWIFFFFPLHLWVFLQMRPSVCPESVGRRGPAMRASVSQFPALRPL